MYIIVANSKNSAENKMYFSHKKTDYWSMGLYYAVLFPSEIKALEMIEFLKSSNLGLAVENIQLQIENN